MTKEEIKEWAETPLKRRDVMKAIFSKHCKDLDEHDAELVGSILETIGSMEGDNNE